MANFFEKARRKYEDASIPSLFQRITRIGHSLISRPTNTSIWDSSQESRKRIRVGTTHERSVINLRVDKVDIRSPQEKKTANSPSGRFSKTGIDLEEQSPHPSVVLMRLESCGVLTSDAEAAEDAEDALRTAWTLRRTRTAPTSPLETASGAKKNSGSTEEEGQRTEDRGKGKKRRETSDDSPELERPRLRLALLRQESPSPSFFSSHMSVFSLGPESLAASRSDVLRFFSFLDLVYTLRSSVLGVFPMRLNFFSPRSLPM